MQITQVKLFTRRFTYKDESAREVEALQGDVNTWLSHNAETIHVDDIRQEHSAGIHSMAVRYRTEKPDAVVA